MFVGAVLWDFLVVPCAAIGMFVGAMFAWPWLNLLQKHIEVPKNLFYSGLRGLFWTACIGVSIAYFDIRALYFIPVGILFGLPYYGLSFIDENKARAWGEYVWGAILWGSLVIWL